MSYSLCHLNANSATYAAASHPSGWDVIVGHLDCQVALWMIKHSRNCKLIRCVNVRANCRQTYVNT